MTSVRVWALGGVLWLASAPWMAHAAQRVSDLYVASVPVASQQPEERARAIRMALGEVVLRVSGRRLAQGDPLLRDAERLMQQYRYEMAGPEGAAPGRQRMRVSFDPPAVERELRERGLPVWGSERPATLIWLAVEDEAGRRLMGTEGPSPYQVPLMEAATRRGVPLVWPLHDREDLASLRVEDVWNDSADAILNASRRYRVEAVLAGRLRLESGAWRGRWTLYRDGAAQRWKTEGSTADEALQAALDGQAERLARQFAPTSAAGAHSLAVVVSEVNSLADYARASRYLKELPGVSAAWPVLVDPNRVEFHLETEVTRADLARTIALAGVLEPAPHGAAPPEDSANLYYHLSP